MKTRVLFPILLTLFMLSSCKGHAGASGDHGVVNQFYDNIALIVNNPYSDEAYNARENCIEMCNDYALNFPNEFKWMGDSDRDENLIISSYLAFLCRFSNRNTVQFHYSIKDSFPFPEDSTGLFRYHIVRKEYAMQDYNCSFVDTVLVSCDSLIIGIRNKAGGHAYTKYEMSEHVPEIMTKD